MGPAKSDWLKPQLRLNLERSRGIPGRYNVAYRTARVCESRIISRVARDGDVLFRGSLIETVRQQTVILQVSNRVQQAGGDLAFGILQNRFVNLHLLRTGNLAVMRLELQRVFVVVVADDRSVRI